MRFLSSPPNHNGIPESVFPLPWHLTLSMQRRARSAVRYMLLLGVCGYTDHVNHDLRMGKHWNMATVDFVNGRAHTLRHKALQLRLHSAVASGHDIPARFGLPGHASRILVE